MVKGMGEKGKTTTGRDKLVVKGGRKALVGRALGD